MGTARLRYPHETGRNTRVDHRTQAFEALVSGGDAEAREQKQDEEQEAKSSFSRVPCN